MSTPQQQQEFEAAIQQHIQQAVAAALAGMPPHPRRRPSMLMQSPSSYQTFGQQIRRPGFIKLRPPFAAPTSRHPSPNTTTS
jgi:hypothetical protein